VNESYSEQECCEKTIEASAVAKYDQNMRNLDYPDYKVHNAHNQILNDENMRTQKNSNKYYSEFIPAKQYNKSAHNESQGSNAGAQKYRKHCKKLSMDENIENPQTSRNISRHRRISAPENYHPTIIRNMSNPELVNEYDITERLPIETSGIQSSKHNYSNKISSHFKDKAEYTKYADKYSLTKN
jgi:hypothetical protein